MAVTDNAATGGADLNEQPPDALIEAATALLAAVSELGLPLDLPTAEPARRARTEIEHILTAAILPRLRTPDAPLLCALAGPTGVGKSTLLNALAGATLSATGPLRPTTRTAVLVCHPADIAGMGATAEADADADADAAAEQVEELAAPHEAAAQADDAAAAEGNFEQVGDQAADGNEVPVAGPDGESDAAADISALADDAAAGKLGEHEGESQAGELTEPHSETEAGEPADASPSEPSEPASASLSESRESSEPANASQPGHLGEPTGEIQAGAGESGAAPSTSVDVPESIDVPENTDAPVPFGVLVPVGQAGQRSGCGDPGLSARVGAGLASLLSSPLPSPSLPRGIAVVDTVDGDVAVVEAADVVVVVVSAERYADAAVWRVLRRVSGWGTPIVVVLGRVAAGVVEEVSGAFVELLRVNGLGSVPYFVVEEVGGAGDGGEGARARGAFPGDSSALPMDGGRGESGAEDGGSAPGEGGYGDGGLGCAGEPAGGTGSEIGDGSGAPLLPSTAVAGLHGWLKDAGADTAGRVRIGMLGVAGRLDSVDRLVRELADAWEGQRLALQVLHQGLERVHTAERMRFRGAVDAGELLGGEVRIRWQELLGSGRVSALFGAEDGAGKRRRKRKRAEADWSARFHNPTGHDVATAPLRAALVDAVARGHRGALERAARKTVDQWELTPGAPEPGQPDDATRRATDPARAAAEWLDHLPTVILDQAHSRRTTRTIGPAGAHIRSAALVLGVAVLAGSDSETLAADTGTAYEDPAAEAAVGLLHTMFGEDADRLRATTSAALKDANARLLDHACQPHRARLAAHTLDPRQAQALADARAAVARARNEED